VKVGSASIYQARETKDVCAEKIKDIKREMGEGSTAKRVGDKVKIRLKIRKIIIGKIFVV